MAGASSAQMAYRTLARTELRNERVPAAALAHVLAAVGTADRAIVARDLMAANGRLIEAQQVMTLLRNALDHRADAGLSANLERLYNYVIAELARANLEKSRTRLAALVMVLTPLHDAWQRAADTVLRGSEARAAGGVVA